MFKNTYEFVYNRELLYQGVYYPKRIVNNNYNCHFLILRSDLSLVHWTLTNQTWGISVILHRWGGGGLINLRGRWTTYHRFKSWITNSNPHKSVIQDLKRGYVVQLPLQFIKFNPCPLSSFHLKAYRNTSPSIFQLLGFQD